MENIVLIMLQYLVVKVRGCRNSHLTWNRSPCVQSPEQTTSSSGTLYLFPCSSLFCVTVSVLCHYTKSQIRARASNSFEPALFNLKRWQPSLDLEMSTGTMYNIIESFCLTHSVSSCFRKPHSGDCVAAATESRRDIKRCPSSVLPEMALCAHVAGFFTWFRFSFRPSDVFASA
ncbi:hypothetical protein KC19_12G160500 [Ceratodon purpureus]|uniref:Uncharacterized protein n=1 Tax=Ceratodon purpureus TaxID=3225 RepID=A0A8T0GBG3_CERPU|nr:hypothetical protein KC19_12G160500 [Ceratodon purpureus]